MSTAILLDEGGVKITQDWLTVPGRSFKWRNLGIVQVARAQNASGEPTIHLVISTKTNPQPVSVFETKDAALMQRVEQAINQVAAALGAKRE